MCATGRSRAGMDNAQMPTILVDPQPRTMDAMLDAATRARLDALGDLVVHEGPGRMPDDVVEAHLADTVAIVGQTDLDADRIARAPRLRAVDQRRGQLPAQRRLRGLLRARHPRPRGQPRLRPGRGRGGARHGHRPRARHHRGRPRHARRHRGLRARAPTAAASCSPAATSASSGSATSGASSCACSRPSAAACAPTTRGCPSWPIRAAGAEPAGLDELLRRLARGLRLRRAHDRQPGDARPPRARAPAARAPRCSS